MRRYGLQRCVGALDSRIRAGVRVTDDAEVVDARLMVAWLRDAANVVRAERDYLTELDAAIGDADHGVNLDRGLAAVQNALNEAVPATPGAVLALAGRTLISSVGGASGPLYGTVLREAAKVFDDTAQVDAAALSAALQAGLSGVQRVGGAAEGDKTMVDALVPACAAMASAVTSGAGLEEAVRAAAKAAEEGARATVPLEAHKGRASYLGPRSVGHQDPGATSTALLLTALQHVVERPRP
jgi:phosphoenolpyruvate---glycerone phosphotransferase subunit DhaL